MKYNVQFTLCCFLLLCAATGSAQNFSQDWANYNSYLDVAKETQAEGSVHEFSGAATYSFGFHSLAVDGQSFPISISYFSNGVKVDEYASAVGLGWNLNAGGSITKITRGLDDEDAVKGYNAVGAPSGDWEQAKTIYQGTRDGEKDYYVFNAFGLSGSFIYHNGTFVPMSGEKISVTYSTSPSPNFIIQDDQGNTYHFTLQETIHTYSGSIYNLVNSVKGNWFLTKVVTALNQEINLSYETKTVTGLKTSFSELRGFGNGTCVPPYNGELTILNTYESYRVSSIASSRETISFTYDTRTDIPDDKALKKIEVMKGTTPYNRFLLNHSYLSGRLMLVSIADKNYTTAVEENLVSFDYYNDFTMPLPLSEQSQDMGGYFNNQPIYLHSVYNRPSLMPFINFDYDGAIRTIAAVGTVQTLMLKKITNRYGRVQELEYELNTYRELIPPLNTPGSTNYTAFGVRVKKLVSYDHTQPAKKRYIWYKYEDENGNPTGVKTNTLEGLTVLANGSCSGIVRRSKASSRHVRTLDFNGIYTKVKVQVYTDEGNVSGSTLGYTINEYDRDASPIDQSTGTSIWTIAKHRWGLLKSSKSYNSGGQLVDENTYTYSEPSSWTYDNVYTYLGRMETIITAGMAVQTYRLTAGYMRLTESVHKTYSPTAALLLTEKKTYTYDALNYVSQIEVYRNNVLKETTTFKRPQQFTLSPGSTDPHIRAVQELGARKIYSPVLETVTTRNDVSPAVVTAASANLYTYDFTRNIILPASSYTHRAVDPANQSFSDMTVNNSMVSLSGTYAQTQEVLAFDDTYPAEVKTNGLDYSSAYYTLDGNTYCSFTNTPLSHTAFMGFEQAEMDKAGLSYVVQSGWELVNSCPGDLVQTAYTGTAAFSLSACLSTSLQLTRTLDPNRKYRLQFWHKKNSGTAVADVSSAPAVLFSTSTWQLVEYLVENETGLSITGTGIIDDVRLFPAEASCSYATYNGLGLKTSECDASGQCLFYEYDEHYRPLTIKDVRGSILKRFEYGIQEQQ